MTKKISGQNARHIRSILVPPEFVTDVVKIVKENPSKSIRKLAPAGKQLGVLSRRT